MTRVVLLVIFYVCVHAQDSDGPVAIAPVGPVLGSWMESRRGRSFQAYRGIRYAQPPVGALRFQPPQQIFRSASSGPLDARSDGPACPQPAPFDYNVDEDCLRINVYTPSTSGRLPVIFYIPAGSFYGGSGRSDVAGPHYLMDRDVVLVTHNYRLGTLGFLSMDNALAPGNNGLKDQVAALRWVQRNIASFGGDPGLVTLMGYNAGAVSAGLHMVSPMSRGLFHRAVILGGSPTSQVPVRDDQTNLAVRQARLLGCREIDADTQIVNCLRSRHWSEFANTLPGFFDFGTDPLYIWYPVVEPDFGQERFLTARPVDLIRRRRINAVPVLLGQTRDGYYWKAMVALQNATMLNLLNNNWVTTSRSAFMLPETGLFSSWASLDEAANTLGSRYRGTAGAGRGARRIGNDTASASGLGNLYRDATVGFGMHRFANLLARRSPQPVYRYEFNYIGNSSNYVDRPLGRATGAAHLDDLIYMLSAPLLFPRIPALSDSTDSLIVDRMTSYLYNFAVSGDPNPPSPSPLLPSLPWRAMTPRERRYLTIGRTLVMDRELREDLYRVWDSLYPIDY